jgi:hypothetical protein
MSQINRRIVLLNGVTAIQQGNVVIDVPVPVSFIPWVKGTAGTVTATVNLYASNDDSCRSSPLAQSASAAVLLATWSLSGTLQAVDTSGVVVATSYLYWWGTVSAISGTNAAVFLIGAAPV